MYCPILGDSSSKRLCQAWTNPWTNKRWANLFAFLSLVISNTFICKTYFAAPAQALLGGTSCWDDRPPKRGKVEGGTVRCMP